MQSVILRQNIIENINTLSSEMLEELNKFLSFLKYKNESTTDDIIDYKQTVKFREEQKRLQSVYDSVIAGQATLLFEDEFNDKMDNFVANLEMKYADN